MRRNRPVYILCLVVPAFLLFACRSSRKLTADYYYENEAALTSIEKAYASLYKQRPFSVEFIDKGFNYVSLMLQSNRIKYIYEFELNEPRLQDTLARYQMDSAAIMKMIRQMKDIQCVWINNLDYYVDEQKRSMIFMSLRTVPPRIPFAEKKYYILTFFNQPQFFDNQGRLLANRRQRRLRKIDDNFFQRINDRVCYTISERFR
ncbi:hypothetical protein [Sediminibacterium ginsengisoli]|uniref:Lipoprotein n=1 Tax=Sediminibacterium ginsengisoli TaxID=413434 RepID=A0A1T4RAK8_9BACT|nr:hypothetical protein [Sediminibacterium ginsengisoli]SKA12671.1 hypothetical protein SAMN04488132_11155 [Sediminibacterium ginsengisoli]